MARRRRLTALRDGLAIVEAQIVAATARGQVSRLPSLRAQRDQYLTDLTREEGNT